MTPAIIKDVLTPQLAQLLAIEDSEERQRYMALQSLFFSTELPKTSKVAHHPQALKTAHPSHI